MLSKLYDDNHVAIAGHCIYNLDPNIVRCWLGLERDRFPGQNGSTKPYPTCNGVTLISNTGWTVNGNIEYDYGSVAVNCSYSNLGNIGFTSRALGDGCCQGRSATDDLGSIHSQSW